jgi:nucleotide-binding universal stress UspA family protein
VDFSKCSGAAVEHAVALCKVFHARLTLLHVVEPAVHGDNYVTAAASLDPLNQNLVEVAREKLDHYAQESVGGEAPADVLVRLGRAHSEIPDTAEALGADLIVVGSCGTSQMKSTLLGSTAERVVRHAPCPVLTVRCVPPPHSLRHA